MDKYDEMRRAKITQYLCKHGGSTTAQIAGLEEGNNALIVWVWCREALDMMVRDGLCEKEDIDGVVYFRLTEKGRVCKQDCSTAE